MTIGSVYGVGQNQQAFRADNSLIKDTVPNYVNNTKEKGMSNTAKGAIVTAAVALAGLGIYALTKKKPPVKMFKAASGGNVQIPTPAKMFELASGGNAKITTPVKMLQTAAGKKVQIPKELQQHRDCVAKIIKAIRRGDAEAAAEAFKESVFLNYNVHAGRENFIKKHPALKESLIGVMEQQKLGLKNFLEKPKNAATISKMVNIVHRSAA